MKLPSLLFSTWQMVSILFLIFSDETFNLLNQKILYEQNANDLTLFKRIIDKDAISMVGLRQKMAVKNIIPPLFGGISVKIYVKYSLVI